MADRRRQGSIVALVLLTVVAIGVAGFALLRPGGPPPASSSSQEVRSHTYAPDERVSLSVYGTSVSVGDSQSFNSLDTGDTSWVHYLDTTKIRFTGGFARPGLTTGMALEERVPGLSTDVFVLELGTNDIRIAALRSSDPTKAANRAVRNLKQLTKGLQPSSPGRVIVVAVGPMNDRSSADLEAFEAQVRQGVEAEGWTYVDPWDGLHRPDARWLWRRDLTDDNVHPNAKGAKLLGKALQREILAAAR